MSAELVRIHYLRPPDREQIFEQHVVHERADVIVTLARSIEFGEPMRIGGRVVLEAGADVVWFTFPGAWHDIGRFHRADGTFTGLYANVLTPPRIEGRTWWTTDLFLDVWRDTDGRVRVLDEAELDEAELRGDVEPDVAARARDEATRITRLAERGLWPPELVEEWTLRAAREALARSDQSASAR